MLQGTAVTEAALMAAKEKIARWRKKILFFYAAGNENYLAAKDEPMKETNPHAIALISYALNIPGPVKTNPALKKLFFDGLATIHTVLSELHIVEIGEAAHFQPTGDIAFIVVDDAPKTVRDLMTGIVETHPFGGAFSIDVFTSEGNIVPERKNAFHPCLCCDDESTICQKNQRHTEEEILDCLDTMLLVNGYLD